MREQRMTRALEELTARYEPTDSERLWEDIIRESWMLPIERGEEVPEPGERMARFRERLRGELVAFHKRLPVSPYEGTDVYRTPGCALWRVDIPLTLFPKRDQGFSRVECIVEFRAEEDEGDVFRVVKLLPEERGVVMARAELGGELQVDGRAKLGFKLPLGTAMVADEVGARVYAQGQVGPLVYEAARTCVETEIVEGTGARWRLDDTTSMRKVGAESHQLAAVLEVRGGAPRIDAAGYLQAYSDVNWLTQTLGSFWMNLKESLRNFFRRGVPVEAYGEWSDIIPLPLGRGVSAEPAPAH